MINSYMSNALIFIFDLVEVIVVISHILMQNAFGIIALAILPLYYLSQSKILLALN